MQISIEAVFALVAYLPLISAVSFLVKTMLTLASMDLKPIGILAMSSRHLDQNKNLKRILKFVNANLSSQMKENTTDARRENKTNIRDWSDNSRSRSFLRPRAPNVQSRRSTFQPILQPEESVLVVPQTDSLPLLSNCRSHQPHHLYTSPLTKMQRTSLVN